jgi:hypothetical protein
MWTSDSRIVHFSCPRHNEFATRACASEIAPLAAQSGLKKVGTTYVFQGCKFMRRSRSAKRGSERSGSNFGSNFNGFRCGYRAILISLLQPLECLIVFSSVFLRLNSSRFGVFEPKLPPYSHGSSFSCAYSRHLEFRSVRIASSANSLTMSFAG